MADSFRYDLIPSGVSVLCALSGGADSMYLLCRLLEGAAEGGYTVRCAHYNHRLRDTAGRDEQFVRDWCERLGVPLTVGSGDVAGQSAALGRGIEETARDLRYAFLRETAAREGCALIATGHQAGDNAETVLMNLVRGCGLNGLAGIPERRDGLIRPMLALTRAEIEAYLTAHGVPHAEDESNGDLSYTRNKVRHRLLPLLEELNPRAAAHIAAAARRAAEDNEALERQAQELLTLCRETEGGVSLPVSALVGAPRPIALRVLRRLAPGAQSVHLEALLALCGSDRTSGQLDLPLGRARRSCGWLILARADPPAPPEPAPLREGVNLWGGWRITCAPALCPSKAYTAPGEFCLKPDSYLIRSRREGDEVKLGRRPEKTVKKLMIEGRVPRCERAGVPVLAGSGDTVAAVAGFGPHRDALALPGRPCLRITIRKGEE